MEVESFKEQQQDRIDEGKDLKREDELKDLGEIPKKDLPAGQSLLSKISETISHAASTITDKVGFKDITVEGHEDLDKDVRKQVKKVNKEILKQPERESQGPEKPSEWANALPRHAAQGIENIKQKTEGVKGQTEGLARKISGAVDNIKDSGNLSSKDSAPKEGTSLLGKIQQSVHDVSEKISHGVESLKQRFSEGKAEEREDDGTKEFRKVKDGFDESVDDLKREQRVEELGQQELISKNPFQNLSSGNKDESENRTLGEKIKDGVNDTGSKISSKIGEVSQKVRSTFEHKENAPQDKENVQQVS